MATRRRSSATPSTSRRATSCAPRTAPARGGPEWTPEHLLLAALLRCSRQEPPAITRSAPASRSRARRDRRRRSFSRRESDGRFAVDRADVELELKLEPQPGEAELAELLAKAERDCFIGASLTAEADVRLACRLAERLPVGRARPERRRGSSRVLPAPRARDRGRRHGGRGSPCPRRRPSPRGLPSSSAGQQRRHADMGAALGTNRVRGRGEVGEPSPVASRNEYTVSQRCRRSTRDARRRALRVFLTRDRSSRARRARRGAAPSS